MTLDINLTAHPKFYAIKGKATLTLKPIIPKNSTKPGTLRNPIYNKKHGYMYFKNDTNKRKLEKFVDKIVPGIDKLVKNPNARVSKEVKSNYEMVKHMFQTNQEVKKSNYGILGLQVEYTPSKWVTNVTGDNWDAKFNPVFVY